MDLTERTERQCLRCGEGYQRPAEDTMAYVRSDEFVVEEETEAMYAERLTDEGKEVRDAVRDSEDLNISQANNVLARRDDHYLGEVSIAVDDLVELEQVDAPVTPEEDPNVLRTVTRTVTVEDQKHGLVCLSCVQDDDEVIWGDVEDEDVDPVLL